MNHSLTRWESADGLDLLHLWRKVSSCSPLTVNQMSLPTPLARGQGCSLPCLSPEELLGGGRCILLLVSTCTTPLKRNHFASNPPQWEGISVGPPPCEGGGQPFYHS